MKNWAGVIGLILLILGMAALVFIAQTTWQVKKIPQESIDDTLVQKQTSDTVTTTNIWAGDQSSSSTKETDKKQTIEIFVFNSSTHFGDEITKDCSNAEPLKRTVAWTGGDRLSYYKTAMNALVQGLTQEEKESGYFSAIPSGTELISVIQAENGRYIADFSESLSNVQNPCLQRAIRVQVQNTLAHVPLQGKTLLGDMTINKKIINW